MLEDINSLDSLEKIADSAEVDVIYVAKYDLAVSMGHSSDINHSEVNQTVESAIKKNYSKRQKPPGVWFIVRLKLTFTKNWEQIF